MTGAFRLLSRLMVSLGVLCALYAGPARSETAEYGERRFPVYLNVDGDYIRTAMQLVSEVRAYGNGAGIASTDGSVAARGDAELAAMLAFFEALRRDDAASLEKSFEPVKARDPLQSAAGATVTVPVRSAGEMAMLYRSAFSNLNGAQVLAKVRVSRGALFLWRGQTPKGPSIRGFVLLGSAVPGVRRVAEVTMLDPVETFIVNTIGRVPSEELGRILASPRSRASGQQARLALDDRGNELAFAGQGLAVALRPGAVLPKTGAEAAVAGAWKASVDKDQDRLASFYTAVSARRFREWMRTMKEGEADGFLAYQGRAATLRYVIDAGPVAIVLVQRGTGAEDGIAHHTLVRAGERYLICNLNRETFFDDLIRSNRDIQRLVSPAAPEGKGPSARR